LPSKNADRKKGGNHIIYLQKQSTGRQLEHDRGGRAGGQKRSKEKEGGRESKHNVLRVKKVPKSSLTTTTTGKRFGGGGDPEQETL